MRSTLGICLALIALNCWVCWPLFRSEYLNDFQSNEGSFITFAKFLLEHWPHVGWFPWFNAGMPFENTYLPLVSSLAALVAWACRLSPAQAFHCIAALCYALAPVGLFLFARTLSGRPFPSAWAAALWSLLSPSIVFPQILRDIGTPWGIRRLQSIVFYGETPHNVALCFLPLSLALLAMGLERPTLRFCLAALASAAVMLSNAFGVVVVSLFAAILFVTARKYNGARTGEHALRWQIRVRVSYHGLTLESAVSQSRWPFARSRCESRTGPRIDAGEPANTRSGWLRKRS